MGIDLLMVVTHDRVLSLRRRAQSRGWVPRMGLADILELIISVALLVYLTIALISDRSGSDVTTILVYLVILTALTPADSAYMYRVYTSETVPAMSGRHLPVAGRGRSGAR